MIHTTSPCLVMFPRIPEKCVAVHNALKSMLARLVRCRLYASGWAAVASASLYIGAWIVPVIVLGTL